MRAAALVAFGALVISACCALISCGGFTPAEAEHVGETATTIAKCETIGRTCKADGGTRCYGEYRACMTDGGL